MSQIAEKLGLKSVPWLDLVFFSGLFHLFIWMSTHNHISQSELWSIRSSNLIGGKGFDSIVVYYKFIFHALLKFVYLFPLDNWDHILVSRSLFGLLATLYVFLWHRIAWIITKSSTTAFLFTCLLLSHYTFFYNIFRVRADLMAHIFISLAVLQSIKNWELKKPSLNIKLLVLSILSFLCTPKAILSLFGLISFCLLLDLDHGDKKKALRKYLLILLAPFILITHVAIILKLSRLLPVNPYLEAFVYFEHNLVNIFNLNFWRPFFNAVLINLNIYLLLVIGIFYTCIKGNLSKNTTLQSLTIFSLIMWVFFFLHSEKWEYFLACLLPIHLIPIIGLLSQINTKKGSVIFLITIAVFPAYMIHFKPWYFSNRLQKEIIYKLSHLMKSNPETIYFDSTGLLPRNESIAWYLGENDPNSILSVLDIIQDRKPHFIFFTNKVNSAKEPMMKVLLENYQLMANDIWVRESYLRDLVVPNQFVFSDNIKNIFIYDFRPKIRFYDKEHSN